MKQERKEELAVRWMDNEVLSASEHEELAQFLKEEPELEALREGHQLLRNELRGLYAQSRDVPYGDFFQTKLAQAIRDVEASEQKPVRTSGFSWRESLRWWLAPVAVGAMAVAFLAGTRVSKVPSETRLVVAESRPLVYTPEGGVTASVLNADAEGTSVIILDGLVPIPDSFNLMAKAQSSRKDDAASRLILTQKPLRTF